LNVRGKAEESRHAACFSALMFPSMYICQEKYQVALMLQDFPSSLPGNYFELPGFMSYNLF